MQRKNIMLIRFLRPLIHGLVIIGTFWLMQLLRQGTDLIPFVQLRIPQIDPQETLWFAVMTVIVFLIIGLIQGIYELFKPIHGYYKKFLVTWGIWLFVISFLAYMGFGYVFTSGISRFVLVVGALSVWLALTVVDTFINAINRSFETKNPYRVLVLGDDPLVLSQVKQAFAHYTIYRIVFLGERKLSDDLLKLSDIVMSIGSRDNEWLQQLADRVRIAGKTFYHVNDTFFLDDLIAKPHRVGPVMAMEYIPSPLDGWWRVIKRIFDASVAFLAIVFLSPLMAFIAFCIKLDSPGPALYKQKRVGKGMQPFTFVKFRTMYTHLSVGEAYGGNDARELKQELMDSKENIRRGELQKIKNDPRVTKVGRFLRKTSLDELPNLFSVLMGSMSLVGPRPHELFEVDRYKIWQKRLLSVKPGITGYAQLFGRDTLIFDDEAKLDLYYIQHRSLLLDMYVLVGTLKVVLRGS